MKTIAVFSDSHTNSVFGLSKPNVRLASGDILGANLHRKFIFKAWQYCLDEVAKQQQGELHGILNGDILDRDDKGRSDEMITRNDATIAEMATDVFLPFFDLCSTVHVFAGTEAHSGKAAWLEENFATNFNNAVVNPETEKKLFWHALMKVEGVWLDIMHHPRGGGGARPQNSQGVVDRLAADTLFEYANAGEKPPHLVIRSHLHQFLDSREAFSVRGIITPAMSLKNAYTYRLGSSRSRKIGGVLVFCDGGEFEIKPLLVEPKKQQWQVL